MKRILLFLSIFLFAAASLYADHGAQKVLLEADQVKIQVRGVVCSFCSFGTQKNLSKLEFLDSGKFKQGVHMDIESQQITLALDKEKYVDLKKVYTSIKKGGYEPETVYLQVKGKVEKKGGSFFIHDQKSELIFEIQDDINVSGDVSGSLHFDAKLIPSMDSNKPIRAFFDGVMEGN